MFTLGTTSQIAKAKARTAVNIIRSNAEHTFESDGFDMRVCEDATDAIEGCGFREAFWYTSPDVVDDVREWYDDRIDVETPNVVEPCVHVASRHVREAPEGVVEPDTMILIGIGSIGEPPEPIRGVPVIVREPSGVAVVNL